MTHCAASGLQILKVCFMSFYVSERALDSFAVFLCVSPAMTMKTLGGGFHGDHSYAGTPLAGDTVCPLCRAGLTLRVQPGPRALMWGARRAVWVFGQELGQTGAESDGVITLLAALLSALAWMPLFIHPKRHIIGQRRVGYPGHWPQSRGQGEQWGKMKGSVIMGKRQKATLSPNNYFGGKGGRGQSDGGTIRIKSISLASYILIASPVLPREAEDRLRLAEPWLLSDGDWLRPAGRGSDTVVPTVPPLWEKDSARGVMMCMCHCPHACMTNLRAWTALLFAFAGICGSVFLRTTRSLKLWPLTLWPPRGLCLSDLKCSNWPKWPFNCFF